jgi:hypothetical protein
MRRHEAPCRVRRTTLRARLPPLRQSFTTDAWRFIVPLKFEIDLHSGLTSAYLCKRKSISSVRRTRDRRKNIKSVVGVSHACQKRPEIFGENAADSALRTFSRVAFSILRFELLSDLRISVLLFCSFGFLHFSNFEMLISRENIFD